MRMRVGITNFGELNKQKMFFSTSARGFFGFDLGVWEPVTPFVIR